MSWETFLEAHWATIAATDFFAMEVLTLRGLVRYFVLFVIDLRSRRVAIAGIARGPNGAWVEQMERYLTNPNDGILCDASYLTPDRDPLVTRAVGAALRGGSVTPVRLPARSPNLNEYAERFVGYIMSERLTKVSPLGGRRLRQVVTEYTAHYHFERDHQGCGKQLIDNRAGCRSAFGRVHGRERIGWLRKFYFREAA